MGSHYCWVWVFMLGLGLLPGLLNAVKEEPKLEIAKLTRDVYLRGKYVRIAHEIELYNAGSQPVSHFLHLVHRNYSHLALEVLGFTRDNAELPTARVNSKSVDGSVYKISLPFPLEAGDSQHIQILELYRNRLVPQPRALPLGQASQKVEFVDSLYAAAMYPIRSQEILASLPSLRRIEYFTPTGAHQELKGSTIHYGPFVAPYPAHEELRIHYELPKPLIYFQKVERQIELSHLGSISVNENVELKNEGAELEGEFNRIKILAMLQYKQSGHIFTKLRTQLPRKAFGVYYTDAVGNVSTSRATRESTCVQFEIRPRFPVLGGWQTKWSHGYKLQNQFYTRYDPKNRDFYIFNQTFGYAFKQVYAANYELKILLPSGATDVHLYLPFKADVQTETYESYLDVTARKAIVIHKPNMHSYYAKNFLVTYKLSQGKMLDKLAMLVLFFVAFYSLIIFVSRFKLSLD